MKTTLDALEKAITERAAIISSMTVENIIQPSKSMVELAEDFLSNERQIEQMRQSLFRETGEEYTREDDLTKDTDLAIKQFLNITPSKLENPVSNAITDSWKTHFQK